MHSNLLLIFLILGSFIVNAEITLNDILIVDVRTSAEYDSGHIPNSVNIEWQDIMKLNETSAKDKYIYLYCRSGNRSGKAAKILNDNGFMNVINAGSLEEAQIIIDSLNAQEFKLK
tara:strand:+ start:778 stop:1125 length:348 start_codon:yes stop_codon:yes gene_type:complete